MYRRLLAFLRPHWWRMAGTIACNLVAAVLDVFSVTLLIPFLAALFGTAAPGGQIGRLQQRLVGSFIDASDKMGSLRNILLVIMAAVVAKNLLVWVSSQLAASLQDRKSVV